MDDAMLKRLADQAAQERHEAEQADVSAHLEQATKIGRILRIHFEGLVTAGFTELQAMYLTAMVQQQMLFGQGRQ